MRNFAPRILMFCEQFLPVVGGAEHGAYLLASTLRLQGSTVEVLTLRSDSSWPRSEVLPTGVPVHRVPDVDLNRRFRGVRHLGLGRLTLFLRAVRIAIAVRKLASRFDVVHAHNASSPFTAAALRQAQRCGLRTVVTAVNTGDWFDLRVLSRYPRLGERSARWLVENADCWMAVSKAVAADLRGSGLPESRIVHVPYGVSIVDGGVRVPSIASRFLYLGRLATTAPRDVLGLVEAFESVARQSPTAELALVGGGDRLGSIRQAVADSPVGMRIQVPGTGDASTWRRWAHCLVQPSFFEGMSNSLLEAMAEGLACVAYDIPPNREALDEGAAGVLVPVGDRPALARELTRLATVDGAACEWGRRARERAKGVYDIREIARRTRDVYEAVLSDRIVDRRAV